MPILPPGGDREPDKDHPMWEYINDGYNYTAPKRGEIREGIILKIEPNQIIVDVGAKRDAVIPERDLELLSKDERAGLQPGQRIRTLILNTMGPDEELVASINLALQQEDWDRAEKLLRNHDIIECEVNGHNKGGLLVSFGRLQGFVPASHIEGFFPRGGNRQNQLAKYVGKTLPLKVIEVDSDRRRLVMSNRRAQKQWEEEQRADLIEKLEVGDVRRGKVVGFAEFGAFIKIDNATGLAHVSELSWGQIHHPNEVLEIGDEVDVYVLDLDPKRNRLSLSLKQLQPDPWEGIEQRYSIGGFIQGEVVNVVDFGAFVEIEPGVEGLIHMSELGSFDGQPAQVLSAGDQVAVRVIHLDRENQRMGLHLLDIIEPEAEGETPQPEESIGTDEPEAGEPLVEEPGEAGEFAPATLSEPEADTPELKADEPAL